MFVTACVHARGPAAGAPPPAPTPETPANTGGGANAAVPVAEPGAEEELVQAAPSDDHADDEDLPEPPSLPGSSVASKYASLDRDRCEHELDKRHIDYDKVSGGAPGVVAPLRLKSPLSGVTFRSNMSPAMAKKSPYDIYDCRLVLALDDFAHVLSRHDIVEVVHLSVYRPISVKTLKGGVGRRHGGALAIDAALFKTKDGKTLSVERDFHGRIGAKPCPVPQSGGNATELRKIACEANEARLFNVLLTPDYNWAHRNHFHLEVTAGVRWTLVR